jgi:hypothetical protein
MKFRRSGDYTFPSNVISLAISIDIFMLAQATLLLVDCFFKELLSIVNISYRMSAAGLHKTRNSLRFV